MNTKQFIGTDVIGSSSISFRSKSAYKFLLTCHLPFLVIIRPTDTSIFRGSRSQLGSIGIVKPARISKIFNAIVRSIAVYMIQFLGNFSEVPHKNKPMSKIDPSTDPYLAISIAVHRASSAAYFCPIGWGIFPNKQTIMAIIKKISEIGFRRQHMGLYILGAV